MPPTVLEVGALGRGASEVPCFRGRPGLALPHWARGAGTPGGSGEYHSPGSEGSERGGSGLGACPATARLRRDHGFWVLGVAAGGRG